ncbi:hypothetical protein BC937DRAFT_89968 [Endogone sp. FLAS-F59071]|nr:hypothetical protein BC937DRAFT_89968 [Endogone sp. FLAS-F59071]|eukprot:RUS17446.1 hypothetical protein BC937DRAFT_89968 [Endogone sp. FLAS-F59071]
MVPLDSPYSSSSSLSTSISSSSPSNHGVEDMNAGAGTNALSGSAMIMVPLDSPHSLSSSLSTSISSSSPSNHAVKDMNAGAGTSALSGSCGAGAGADGARGGVGRTSAGGVTEAGGRAMRAWVYVRTEISTADFRMHTPVGLWAQEGLRTGENLRTGGAGAGGAGVGAGGASAGFKSTLVLPMITSTFLPVSIPTSALELFLALGLLFASASEPARATTFLPLLVATALGTQVVSEANATVETGLGAGEDLDTGAAAGADVKTGVGTEEYLRGAGVGVDVAAGTGAGTGAGKGMGVGLGAGAGAGAGAGMGTEEHLRTGAGANSGAGVGVDVAAGTGASTGVGMDVGLDAGAGAGIGAGAGAGVDVDLGGGAGFCKIVDIALERIIERVNQGPVASILSLALSSLANSRVEREGFGSTTTGAGRVLRTEGVRQQPTGLMLGSAYGLYAYGIS